MNADAVELRVLGCLIEKQRTTPDVYPLSLNALRLACNQSTNREPVVDYDEPAIRDALQRLSSRGWVRLASGPTSRAVKYRHLFDEALGLSDSEISLLTVLMLRGAQTVGELKSRSERLHRFDSLAEVDESLHVLAGRELVVRLERRPGQKEERWEHQLGDTADATPRRGTAGLARGTRPPARGAGRRAARAGQAVAVTWEGGFTPGTYLATWSGAPTAAVKRRQTPGSAPHCGAPLPADLAPIELRRPRWERLLFATVAVLLVASVVVTVLVIVFGVFVESPGV